MEVVAVAEAVVPQSPPGLADAGLRLWADVQGRYELEEHEARLLLEMCRTVDQLDALSAVVAREGVLLSGRAHPAVVEARQLRIAFARLSAALRLPAGDESDQAAGRRPQRRVGARGVYGGLRVVS